MVLLQFYASELYRGAVCMGGTCFVYKSKRTGALYPNEELSFYDSKRHYDFLFFISERAKKLAICFDEPIRRAEKRE